jgi:exodeoxyribonuclease VII small subunit
MSFEATMEELKKRLDILEKGELTLEESMAAYEQGVALVRQAEQTLATMEGRMEEIMNDGKKVELDSREVMAEHHDHRA